MVAFGHNQTENDLKRRATVTHDDVEFLEALAERVERFSDMDATGHVERVLNDATYRLEPAPVAGSMPLLASAKKHPSSPSADS